jgi:hypothetical protein
MRLAETMGVDGKGSLALRTNRVDSDFRFTGLNDVDNPRVHIEAAGTAWCSLPFEVNETLPAFDLSDEMKFLICLLEFPAKPEDLFLKFQILAAEFKDLYVQSIDSL